MIGGLAPALALSGIPGVMSFEMLMLVTAVALGLAQLVLAAAFLRRQYGLTWAAGPRDDEVPPLYGVGGRVQRAFANFMETFPFFAVAVLAAEVLGRHNGWTLIGAALYVVARIVYLPLYAFGVFLVRSLVWNLATIGVVLVIVGLFQAP